ncbi:MAG: hypothetical protein R3F56_20020 [Planctomycetota bacterium]
MPGLLVSVACAVPVAASAPQAATPAAVAFGSRAELQRLDRRALLRRLQDVLDELVSAEPTPGQDPRALALADAEAALLTALVRAGCDQDLWLSETGAGTESIRFAADGRVDELEHGFRLGGCWVVGRVARAAAEPAFELLEEAWRCAEAAELRPSEMRGLPAAAPMVVTFDDIRAGSDQALAFVVGGLGFSRPRLRTPEFVRDAVVVLLPSADGEPRWLVQGHATVTMRGARRTGEVCLTGAGGQTVTMRVTVTTRHDARTPKSVTARRCGADGTWRAAADFEWLADPMGPPSVRLERAAPGSACIEVFGDGPRRFRLLVSGRSAIAAEEVLVVRVPDHEEPLRIRLAVAD